MRRDKIVVPLRTAFLLALVAVVVLVALLVGALDINDVADDIKDWGA